MMSEKCQTLKAKRCSQSRQRSGGVPNQLLSRSANERTEAWRTCRDTQLGHKIFTFALLYFSLRSFVAVDRGKNLPYLQSRMGTIPRPGANTILSADVRHHFNRDFAEAFVRVGGRIIGDRIGVAQRFADRLECFYLFLPCFSEIHLAAGTSGNAPENVG